MKKLLFILSFAMSGVLLTAQTQVFEEPKDTTTIAKPSVQVGGDFAIQFQSLSHEADNNKLIPLGKGFNLPSANLNLNANLASGVKLNLVTYLSSRHHNETWVKGGYLLMDKLPFLNSAVVDNIMNYMTIKVGVMEVNYGDAHFRRSDNGNVTRNPFVGNYIMDAFTTAPGLELMYRNNGIFAMAALGSGSLKQDLATTKAITKDSSVYTPYNTFDELAYYGKVGYEKSINDLRFRVSVSGYFLSKHHSGSLYNGDRAGSRYYLVMNRVNMRDATGKDISTDITQNVTSGYFSPGSAAKDNSIMANLFANYKGIEFFGTFENAATTTAAGADLKFNQIATEALYRFGGKKQFYGGVRYNIVKGNTKKTDAGVTTETDQTVDRIQVGGGWFLLPSTLIKLEYVKQNYDNFAQFGGKGSFNGIMFEAAISF